MELLFRISAKTRVPAYPTDGLTESKTGSGLRCLSQVTYTVRRPLRVVFGQVRPLARRIVF